MSQNSRPEWDAASACGPVGKPYPASITNSGSHFPPRPSTGNYIPFLDRMLGCSFHRALHRETASHSKGKFRDAASATPPIRKSHPTPHTSGHRTISLLGLPSIKGRPRVMKKSLENFEAFTFVLFCTKDRERRSYSPSTAFLAAAAMLSRSSLVGWSFAATQLSSSILNRALSGSCSSIAS